MNHEHVQVLNYCTHAIDDLTELAEAAQTQMPRTASVLRKVMGMLERSTKFLMPNCGEFIDPHDLRQAHLDLPRIPYPVVAFEAPWIKESSIEYLGEFKQTDSTKRIALCWELSDDFEFLPGINGIGERFPQGGVFVLPIYWTPRSNRWHVAMGGSFVPYENQLTILTDKPNLPKSSVDAQAAVLSAGWAKPSSGQIMLEPFLALPEFFDEAVEHYGDREKAFTQIILDSRDEVQMYVQACAVINCQNVGRVEVPPSASLNKKRQASGKRPFFTYHVLQLNDRTSVHASSALGGVHSSPRMHLRRGHIRRLPNKTVWVRHTMVNAGTSEGVVAKDYSLADVPSESPSTRSGD